MVSQTGEYLFETGDGAYLRIYPDGEQINYRFGNRHASVGPAAPAFGEDGDWFVFVETPSLFWVHDGDGTLTATRFEAASPSRKKVETVTVDFEDPDASGDIPEPVLKAMGKAPTE